MNFKEKAEAISTREDLASFVDELKTDLIQNPKEWENPNLERFLDAMSAWTFSMDNLYKNLGRETPIQPSWKAFAEILLAAKVYE
ncbi:hypothetical protein VINE108274_09570 [Vibrio neptunius]|uniref:DUF7660 family protein n=1 Tax=Vibrio neptunius TaxID=170651 RepID=UPI001C5CB4D8|nr:hypothetical protein [Vibrio neptunius]QXX08937.1 hypothetical protein KW548_17655 [Vibrio neptunius]